MSLDVPPTGACGYALNDVDRRRSEGRATMETTMSLDATPTGASCRLTPSR